MSELRQLLPAFTTESPLERLNDPFSEALPIQLYIKRDDLIHPQISGNKWRKLKYNLLEANRQGHRTLLTFGGAYSNHLYATAAAGQHFGFQTIGVVRGDEIQADQNPTLAFCRSCGMQLHFVSRTAYRNKNETDFIAGLARLFGPFYLVPEGGTNELAIQGASEIMPEIITQLPTSPDFVVCAVGTGGTVTGLAQSAPDTTTVLGVLALKSAKAFDLPSPSPVQLLYDYHFGGYAKTTPELIAFLLDVEHRTGILFEQVYTGKMLYAIYDLARQGFFPPEATVVAIHTGGLQGRGY